MPTKADVAKIAGAPVRNEHGIRYARATRRRTVIVRIATRVIDGIFERLGTSVVFTRLRARQFAGEVIEDDGRRDHVIAVQIFDERWPQSVVRIAFVSPPSLYQFASRPNPVAMPNNLEL